MPEMRLRRALHAHGYRYRLHQRLAPRCTPDLVLSRHRVVVFVDGCFWHSCPRHGRQTPFTGPNASLWEQKMSRNRQRDLEASETASMLGYTVVRLWECQIREDLEGAVAAVDSAAHRTAPQPGRGHL